MLLYTGPGRSSTRWMERKRLSCPSFPQPHRCLVVHVRSAESSELSEPLCSWSGCAAGGGDAGGDESVPADGALAMRAAEAHIGCCVLAGCMELQPLRALDVPGRLSGERTEAMVALTSSTASLPAPRDWCEEHGRLVLPCPLPHSASSGVITCRRGDARAADEATLPRDRSNVNISLTSACSCTTSAASLAIWRDESLVPSRSFSWRTRCP